MDDLRGDADMVIDTIDLNVHQLAAGSEQAFGRRGRPRLRSPCVSFGFKYGLPVDADFVVDMRFLPNPFWVPELRPQTGLGRGGVATTSRPGRGRRSSWTATSPADRRRPRASCARASVS